MEEEEKESNNKINKLENEIKEIKEKNFYLKKKEKTKEKKIIFIENHQINLKIWKLFLSLLLLLLLLL